MTPLARHLGAAVSAPVRSLAHALDLYRRRTMPDPLHPAGYRAAANTPTPPPSETPPSLIDSQMENLQAANRQLRDDLARAEQQNVMLRRDLDKASAFARIIADLDRNSHGRHQGDVDSGDPTGVSQGNPWLPEGTLFGYTIDGIRAAYVVPPRPERYDPAAWVQRP